MKQNWKSLLALTLLVGTVAFGTACGSGNPPAQTTRVKPLESPTPGYKPPKRVSRDIIKTETKEVIKAKAE